MRPLLEQCLGFHRKEDPNNGLPAIIVPGINTYHFGINGYEKTEKNIEELLFLPHVEAGIHNAELSEDIFENDNEKDIFRGLSYEGAVPPEWLARRINKINELAKKHNITIQSTGTGQFLYTRMLAEQKKGYVDMDVIQQAAAMRVFLNFNELASRVGARIVGGHRVITAFPDRHNNKYTVKKFAEFFKWKLPNNVSPQQKISEAEALNINLAIILNSQPGKMSNTVELMYQHDGMAPIGIAQMSRIYSIIQNNCMAQIYAHMDIGHIAVGADGPKNEVDYDIAAYAINMYREAWVVHFNSLYENEHRMPTQANVNLDMAVAAQGKGLGNIPIKKSPYPELYGDVYTDWLVPTAKRSRVMQLTPEPKDTSDLNKLVKEAKEVYGLIQNAIANTHAEAIPGYFVPKEMVKQFQEKFAN